MSEQTFKIMISSLVAVVIILVIMIVVVTKKNKKKNDYSIYSNNRKGIKYSFNNLFNLLDEIPFTRRFVRVYARQFELYYPGDSKESSYRTVKLILKSLIISAIFLLVIFVLNPSLFTFLTAILLSYIFIVEQNCSGISAIEIKFLKSFDIFVSGVRHSYYKCGSIKDALFFAIPELDSMMKGHAEQIYHILNSDDISASTSEYMSQGYHKYLKLFLSLAEMVEENGDIVDENGSVFLNSCMQLRNDVQEDRRYIEERRHKFAALSYTAGLPIAAVPFIAEWGVSTIPSLVGFYMGYSGFVIKVILFALTYVSFCAIVRLREGDRLSKKTYAISSRVAETKGVRFILNQYINKHYGKAMITSNVLKRLCEKYTIKTFYVHKWLISIIVGIVMVFVLNVGHYESRNILKNDVSDVSNLCTTADGRQIEAMEENIVKYVDFVIGKVDKGEYDRKILSESDLKDWLVDSLLEERGIRTVEVADVTSKEIIRRVINYYNETFGFLDLVVICISMLISFIYPSITIKLRISLSENKMQDEVMQFQSIIHMLKKVPGISAMSLLEEMERFADIFRPAIQQCINDYGINDRKAFERLYDAEKYPGLRRIVDSFLLVDEMGVDDAFEEISADIVNFRDNRKLERSMLLDTEGMLGTLVAVLPGGVILFGYLLCPFLIRSVQIFNSYQSELGTLVG